MRRALPHPDEGGCRPRGSQGRVTLHHSCMATRFLYGPSEPTELPAGAGPQPLNRRRCDAERMAANDDQRAVVLVSLATLAAPAHAGSERGRPVWYLPLRDSLSKGVQPGPGATAPPRRLRQPDLRGPAGTNPKLQLTAGLPHHGDDRLDAEGKDALPVPPALSARGSRRVSPRAPRVRGARHHRHRANDIEPSAASRDRRGVRKRLHRRRWNLPRSSALRVAAGPKVPIVGMNTTIHSSPPGFSPTRSSPGCERGADGLQRAPERHLRSPGCRSPTSPPHSIRLTSSRWCR